MGYRKGLGRTIRGLVISSRLGRRGAGALIVLCLVLVCGVFAQDTGKSDLKIRQIESFARSLMDDGRFIEVISYLNSELETIPNQSLSVSLLLTLAEAKIEIGDLSGAKAAIDKAELHSRTSADQTAIEECRGKLAQRSAAYSATVTDREPAESPELMDEAFDDFESLAPLAFVTNAFFETDLRQILTDLSQETGIPILWDQTLEGLVTYEAVNQPLEGVLKAILLPMGYSFSFHDGAYYVGSPSPTNPAFALLSRTEVVTLANVDAREAISMLSEYFKPYVKASSTNNTVCVSAPPAAVERIKADLALLDRPPAQIIIEVIVSEISTSALRKMGLDWTTSGVKENPYWQIGTDHTEIESPSLSAEYLELGAKVGSETFNLATSLEALVQSGDASIRANPRITTLNGRTAEIALTKDQYFIIATTTSLNYQYNTLQAVSSGIRVEITPFASSDGEITVFVKPEVGDVVGQGMNNLPEISKRTANTSVRVRNGEMFTIGGLNIQQEKKIQKKVPILGSIPLLGYLFRYDERDVRETQIVIFITPHILED